MKFVYYQVGKIIPITTHKLAIMIQFECQAYKLLSNLYAWHSNCIIIQLTNTTVSMSIMIQFECQCQFNCIKLYL
jgi:hypothetical protein